MSSKGLVPLFLAAHGADAASVGLVAGIYPAVWGAGQIWTGHWSDRIGRKPLIVAGMLIQATALVVLAASGGVVAVAAVTAALLGVGSALVYPTLIAAISNAVSPVARADGRRVPLLVHMGYVGGGVIAGVVADAIGYGACHRRRGLAHSHVRPLGALRHAGAIHSGTNRLTPEAAPHTPAVTRRPVIGCKTPTISVDDAAAIAIDQPSEYRRTFL